MKMQLVPAPFWPGYAASQRFRVVMRPKAKVTYRLHTSFPLSFSIWLVHRLKLRSDDCLHLPFLFWQLAWRVWPLVRTS
jgi:hypothetical protein